jgi:acetate kinase
MQAEAQGPAAVLALNAGSSSLKFGLYAADGPALWQGQFEGLQPGGTPRWRIGAAAARSLEVGAGGNAFDAALARLVELLADTGERLVAVAHRIVHGGGRFVAPCRIDAAALHELEALNSLAPLHQPHNLAGVRACARAWPGVPQVGCFDTAFHATLPAVEQRLPLPRALAAQGIRRYGFHGLSYDYLSRTLARHTPRAGGRALLAHLGNGSSLCATVGGRSVATSMGFSALDGLMMGTRSGSLDPGVLLHLWRLGWDTPRIEQLLYEESGLQGVSGLSADMRTLRASSHADAAEAIALYTHRVRREAGAMIALLGGLDLLAYTAGIGEHDAVLRAEVAQSLGFIGLRLDARANAEARGDAVQPIHAADSTVEVWVVPTDEGRVAAQAAFAWLAAAGA